MVVEVSQFRLVPGTDDEALLEAAEESQSGFLGHQTGFVSRELLRAEDGSWMDIVRFEDLEAAQAAFQGFSEHPAAKAFEAAIDTSSVSMSHWSLARTW
jgi:hypothetical protein